MKKIILLSFFSFLYACGFTPVLKDIEQKNISVNKTYISGNIDTNTIFLIKNYLSLKETDSNEGIDIILVINETTNSKEKDTAGVTTKEDFVINVNMVIKKNDKILTKDNFSESKEINITSNPEIDDQNKNNEKKNILKNLSRKIKFKTLIVVNNYK